VSGPANPGPGDGDGDGNDEELPWPQPEPGPGVAGDDDGLGPEAGAARDEGGAGGAGDETEGAPTEGAPTRAERRVAHSARGSRRRRVVAVVAGGLLVLVLAFTLWYELESHALGPEGPQVVVTVHEGESTDAIVSALSQQHVIGSSLAFRISNFFHGTPIVLPGSYALHQNQTFAEVRALLAAGPNIYPVDVRPGFTVSEVAAQVDSLPGHARGGFEKVAASGAVHSVFSPPGSNDLEGMFGTGQYLIVPGESDTTILRAMVQRFDRNAAAAGLNTASAAALGLTPYEVITVASVVEKEGYIPVNMPDVARVIYNRLANDMPLQMDSTVLYAIGQDGGPVTAKDLQIQSPYNTYLNKGLPPTPICMPSDDALAAALHPPPGAWLYFVLVQKNGVMGFSDTYAGQLANEQLAKSRGLP
jgi:UPF0755 protein